MSCYADYMKTPLIDSSPLPLYFRVANALEAAIVSDQYAVGMYLPSEKELARRFSVSLITIRAAMSSLIDKGLVERHRGKGTVVSDRNASAVWELGWLGNLITSVLTSKMELVSIGDVRGPLWVTRRLGCSPGATVHFMRTVRFATGRGNEPFMTTELYHPKAIGDALKRSDFEEQEARQRLVIMTVEEKCRISVVNVRQTMTAEAADRGAARLLSVQVGSPLLVVTRDYFDSADRLVQTGRSKYRTDNYEYVLNIARSGADRKGRASAVGSLAEPDSTGTQQLRDRRFRINRLNSAP